jgi:hypothetical protein
LTSTSISSLSTTELMAFWINTYNAFTIRLIVENYPVASIQDLSFNGNTAWDYPFILIHGNRYTLNQIEHDILRKQFFNPRIHFVLNCAAISCPRLMNFAITPENLNETMENATKEFIGNKNRNRITTVKLELSKIFDWYREDFEKEGSLVQFIQKYTPVKIDKSVQITFREYDWGLNGK